MSKTEGKQSYFYSVYGLNIKSEIYINDLVPSQSGEDTNIILRKLNDSYLNSNLKNAVIFERQGCVVRVSKNAICYEWENLGTALVRNGNEVLIDPQDGVDSKDFSPFITGAILAILLNQRGSLVLHSSAVVINGEAVAFLGDKGAGKSTMAAYLQKRGHQFITDDLVPITFTDGKVQVAPGYPRIKLWADSVTSIGLNWESMPKIHKFIDKRSYQCFDSFSAKPVKLRQIYILDENPIIEIKEIKPAKAFIELTKHTYLGKYLQITGQTAENFQHCKAVISTIPVYSLKRPHNHSKLSKVAELIEKHS